MLTMEIATRQCTVCKERKPEIAFRVRSDRKETAKNRHRSECRVCGTISNCKRRTEKKRVDPVYYWNIRSKALNDSSQRRSKRDENTKIEEISCQDVMKLFDNCKSCLYCNVQLTKEDAILEHAIPLSRGGDNVLSNIRISCHDCNQLKGKRTEDEFMTFINQYVNRFNRH